MKISDYKVIYVASKYGNDKTRIDLCDSVIKELIADDKKNNRNGVIYFSPLRAFSWLDDDLDNEESLNCTLKMLTFCDELYVLPDWEGSAGVNQEISVAKVLGIPICYL